MTSLHQRSYWQRSNPFLENEADAGLAMARARRHKEFWSLVFSTGKIGYSEWKSMDLGEYAEAREAYLDYIDSIKQK